MKTENVKINPSTSMTYKGKVYSFAVLDKRLSLIRKAVDPVQQWFQVSFEGPPTDATYVKAVGRMQLSDNKPFAVIILSNDIVYIYAFFSCNWTKIILKESS